MLTRKITKAFEDVVSSSSYFDGWKKCKGRQFRKVENERVQAIDLQFGKYWEKNGGTVTVNLYTGHRWQTPAILPMPPSSWPSDDILPISTRLSPVFNRDHWWKISDSNSDSFAGEFGSLLNDKGLPWFRTVESKEGFLEWYRSIHTYQSAFPYVLELRGPLVLREELYLWLNSLPRSVERTLEWLVKVHSIPEEISARLRLASMQAEDDYRKRITSIIAELKASPPTP